MTNKALIDVSQQPVAAETDEYLDVDKVDGELGLWRSMVEEALKMQGEVYYKVIDRQIRQQLVSPLTVQLEPEDNYETHLRMNLVYQMRISEEPENSLLLLNYAQFLYLVVKDHDRYDLKSYCFRSELCPVIDLRDSNRAEEYFKRAIRVEPQDPEALEQYADFLWKVRNDQPEAEERYLEALEADNMKTPFRASKYAYFLWGTGGEGTCYPV
ncbi:hypothetical protein V6N13_038481 [Hibiscus sabdariffa]|uniref:Tetratricopeptide repeat protein n=1 Tax=Hibiscus sabdariffa TaxID=183260 RepID=A0ABR2S2B7_9ROSI